MSNQLEIKSINRTLRTVIQKNPELTSLLDQLCDLQKSKICITNGDKKVLYGNDEGLEHTFNLIHKNIVYGCLHSDKPQGQLLADLVQLSISKEVEKKEIASEVLGLYREINMIYNFSEMISEKIDDVSIANTALSEAKQIIDITHGSVFILDEESNTVLQTARIGTNPNKNKSIENQNPILKELIKKGTSSIVPITTIEKNSALNHLKAVMYAPLKVKHRTLGLIVLGNENEKEFTAAELKLLTTIAFQSAAAIESAQLYQRGLKEAREREEAIMKIHRASQKFVPHQFIKSLGKEVLTEVELGDQVERDVTVMFVDIRGFTTLSELMQPRENFNFINSFNKRMGPIVRENDGLIMQYLGDGFMALFPNGPQSALRAAVEMQKSLDQYNSERKSKNRYPVEIGIGMQNGSLIMGITGDEERMDAAIISDTVNTAARIEGLSKHYGTSIMLTSICLDNLDDAAEFNFRYLGPVKVKGKERPIELYECIDGDSDHLFRHKINTQDTFKEGMDLYFNKEFAMAAVTFQKVVKKHEDDLPARLFLNRSAQLITKELDEQWKGIEAIDKK